MFQVGNFQQITLEKFYDLNLDVIWYPNIKLINAVRDDLENKVVTVWFQYNIFDDGREEFWIEIKENGFATFMSDFNFKSFPFDVQTLEFIYAERELKDELSQLAIDHYGQEVMPSNNSFGSSGEPTPATGGDAIEEKSDTSTFTDDDIPF